MAEIFILAGQEALPDGDSREVTGDTVEIEAGLYRLDCTVPSPTCEVHLQRLDGGGWHNVIGHLAEFPEHGDVCGPRTFRPEPIRLPACSVRLEAPFSRFPTGISATLTSIE